MEVREKRIEIEWDQVQAVLFSPALIGSLPSEREFLALGLKDGSRLNVKEIQRNKETVAFKLLSGHQTSSFDKSDEFVEAVRFLSTVSEQSLFLPEMEVAKYKNLTESSLIWDLGKNQDCYGRPLVTPQRGLVPHGLAMHSTSQVAYRYDGSPGEFLAEICFAAPQLAGSHKTGKVRCAVLLAKEGKLVEAASYKLNRSLGETAIVQVDVTAAQLIVLITEPFQSDDAGDHMLWLDARIHKN